MARLKYSSTIVAMNASILYEDLDYHKVHHSNEVKGTVKLVRWIHLILEIGSAFPKTYAGLFG